MARDCSDSMLLRLGLRLPGLRVQVEQRQEGRQLHQRQAQRHPPEPPRRGPSAHSGPQFHFQPWRKYFHKKSSESAENIAATLRN